MSREQRDQALFNKIACDYAKKDFSKASSQIRREQLIKDIQPLLDKSSSLGYVVDIGCGVGALSQYLDGFYEHYLGIDQSEEMIRLGEEFYKNNPRVSFLEKNIKSRDLPSKVADLVICRGALHHMTGLDEVIRSVTRIAKPGAMFLAQEPQSKNPVIQFMRWIRGLVDSSYSKEQTFFSEEELYDLLKTQNMRNITISYYGYFAPLFSECVFLPQILAVPLARLALTCDNWLERNLPKNIKKWSFYLTVKAKFPD